MRLDCAQTEVGFLRKRVSQLEERLESERNAKRELEQKVGWPRGLGWVGASGAGCAACPPQTEACLGHSGRGVALLTVGGLVAVLTPVQRSAFHFNVGQQLCMNPSS